MASEVAVTTSKSFRWFQRSSYMIRFFYLAFIFIALSMQQGRAAVVLDPYVGYVGGNSSGTLVDGVTTFKGSYGGLGYGARLALSLPVVFFGVDYGLDTLNYTAGDSNSTNNVTTFATTYGIFGFHFSGFRIYGGYGFSDIATLTAHGSSDVSTGKAAKVGLSYHLFAHVALSLEYVTHTSINYTPAGGSQTPIANVFKEWNVATYFVGLSFPFWF
jgi:hypothetical protein